MSNFFKENSNVIAKNAPLKSWKRKYNIKQSYLQLLSEEAGMDSYKVVAISVNKVTFGRLEMGELIMSDGALEEEYLQELRVFNADKEIYLRKKGDKYQVRVIEDGSGSAEAKELDYVDSTSNLFGDRVKADVPAGFAMLKEAGRKITLVIPVDEEAEHYALTTRSYIEYDEETGQAGYGYYRYVAIAAAVKG